MAIPSETTALIERLNQELDQTSQEATEGLNIARSGLFRFPDNALLIQFFASLSSIRLFLDNSRGRIQTVVEKISETGVNTDEVIQEAGEDLSTLLGLIANCARSLYRFPIIEIEVWKAICYGSSLASCSSKSSNCDTRRGRSS